MASPPGGFLALGDLPGIAGHRVKPPIWVKCGGFPIFHSQSPRLCSQRKNTAEEEEREEPKPPEDLLPEEEIDKRLDSLFPSEDLLLSLDDQKMGLPGAAAAAGGAGGGDESFDDILKSIEEGREGRGGKTSASSISNSCSSLHLMLSRSLHTPPLPNPSLLLLLLLLPEQVVSWTMCFRWIRQDSPRRRWVCQGATVTVSRSH